MNIGGVEGQDPEVMNTPPILPIYFISHTQTSLIFVLVVHLAIGFTAHMAPAALVCSLLYGRLRSLGIGIYDLVTMTYELLVLAMSMFSLCKAF